MNIFTTSDPTLLILLTLVSVISLVLLVIVVVAWFRLLQQYNRGKPSAHHRDDANYKRGV